MSSPSENPTDAGESPNPNPAAVATDDSSTDNTQPSKKAAKKEAAKLEKLRRQQEAAAAARALAEAALTDGPLSSNYGDIPLKDLQSKEISGRKWTEVRELDEGMKDRVVLVRGRAQTIRAVSKKMAFVVLRKRGFTVQCILSVAPDRYLRKTLKLTFKEGVEMLMEAGVEVDPLGDLNTESERKLGQLVFEKYGTEFYILHRYPLAVRPFYTMPCYDDPAYSNSFDVFIRGEEIISGAQRVHDPEFLKQRAESCGIDVRTISTYIDSFRYGAPPHGGFGVGLERVIMLFCALNNIRKTSLYPRDPLRIAP